MIGVPRVSAGADVSPAYPTVRRPEDAVGTRSTAISLSFMEFLR